MFRVGGRLGALYIQHSLYIVLHVFDCGYLSTFLLLKAKKNKKCWCQLVSHHRTLGTPCLLEGAAEQRGHRSMRNDRLGGCRKGWSTLQNTFEGGCGCFFSLSVAHF